MPQAGREPLRRWDPERIGPYVILGRLGAGAMGQVYLGRSAAGRLVAVKTIKVGLAEDAGFRTRFAQEVAAARRVSGAFTAAVVEADPDADVPWLATSYVPAPSLNRLVLVCGPLPVQAVRWLAAGCAEALESIHGAGLVHRDLKPSNVLVAPDGPRVIDFGVARAAERMALTTARGAVGTPAYMAPEQARDTRQASVASDVYSLGATLLFAASGHPPYAGDTVMDVLARLATEDPDLSGLPEALTELVSACMHRVPRMRPTSSQMLARLGHFAEAGAGEHSYLPEPAMALIGGYQRNPLLASGQKEPGQPPPAEDATSASYTELPASYKPPPPRRPARRAPWRWIRTHMAWVGWASVGAALIAAGVVLGASLSSSSSSPGSGRSASAGTGAGPPAAPVAPSTVCGTQVKPGPAPVLCMDRNYGYQRTAFVVRGDGFAPHAHVSVTLSEVGPPSSLGQVIRPTPPLTLIAGPDGTFQVPASRLYSSTLALGMVTVKAAGSGGRTLSTSFIVIPDQAPPPANGAINTTGDQAQT
jgi:serine/threonine protein kinase